MAKFVRRAWHKMSKLGKGRKKKQVWRRPGGRDNPMREKRKGYGAIVSIGYGTPKEERGKIKGKNTITINNIIDLEKVNKNDLVIIGNIGKKKKLEILKKAKTQGIEIHNANVKKFLKKNKMKGEKKNESK